jgi:hypothetical protein
VLSLAIHNYRLKTTWDEQQKDLESTVEIFGNLKESIGSIIFARIIVETLEKEQNQKKHITIAEKQHIVNEILKNQLDKHQIKVNMTKDKQTSKQQSHDDAKELALLTAMIGSNDDSSKKVNSESQISEQKGSSII